MFSGSGPGVQAPDGCSVELYDRLPYLGDLDAVRSFLEPGASVLELGCGTGRLTRKLLEWGLSPTSVDNSPAMLAQLPVGARAVLSGIESLALNQRFDIALLASCLINHPLAQTRDAFLSAAAGHLRPGGRVLVERHDPEWLGTADIGVVGKAGPVSIRLESVARDGAIVHMTVRYEVEELSWIHAFSTEILNEAQIERLLHRHGLCSVSWHGRARRWAVATA